MIANVVFLLMILGGCVLASIGAAAWVNLAVREQIRADNRRIANGGRWR